MNEERIRDLVRQALPPLQRTEPRRDLWPLMRERLEGHVVHFTLRLTWLDRALLASVALALILFPRLIPMLLYQL